jgi:hypothetical protein
MEGPTVARHIHIYFRDALIVPSSAYDSAEVTARDYEQLAEELLAFIAEKSGQTKDAEWKEEDHPRAANGQFGQGGGGVAPKKEAGALGPKPTSTTAKIAKHAVHELLSSGHPWSIDELAQITGHANKTSLSSWLSMFKNEKTAGPKGKLDIVKLPGGMYQVVKKDGTPAPAVEVPKVAPAPQKKPEAPKPTPKPVAKPPAVPTPPPQAKPASAPRAEFGRSTVKLPKPSVSLSSADFTSAVPGSDPFNKARLGLLDSMKEGSWGADQLKQQVEESLTEALKESKAFQAFKDVVAKFGKKQHGPERLMISAWASSSGDHNPLSVAMQLAVRDAFNLKDTEIGGMGMLRETPEDFVLTTAAASLGYKTDTPERKEIFKEALRDFAKAQYNSTQEWFKKRGITEVCVVRGMKTKAPDSPEVVSMGLQPASSFSAKVGTAASFSGDGTMLIAKVPVSHVLSHYRTGFGCANEHEVVVLGDRALTAVAARTGQASSGVFLANAARKALAKQAVPA